MDGKRTIYIIKKNLNQEPREIPKERNGTSKEEKNELQKMLQMAKEKIAEKCNEETENRNTQNAQKSENKKPEEDPDLNSIIDNTKDDMLIFIYRIVLKVVHFLMNPQKTNVMMLELAMDIFNEACQRYEDPQ